MALRQALYNQSRGMNRVSDRLNMSPEFDFDLLNGYVRKDVKTGLGIRTQRAGSAKFNAVVLSTDDYGSTKSIRTLFETRWNGGSVDLICRAGTAWGKFDGVDTFEAIDTGRTNDALGQCAMFKNELLMVDGGVPRKMTAGFSVSALSSDAAMPQDADAVWVHRDKVWLNSQALPMIAFFSKTNNANGSSAWSGTTDAGTIDLSTVLPTGDRIRGFRTYGGKDSGLIAIICDQYTVIYAAGSNVYDFTFVQYFPTTCLAMNAAAYVGTDLVYPSRNVLTSIVSAYKNQELDVTSLSRYVEPLYRALVAEVTTSQHISGVFNKALNHYYVSFPVGAVTQTLVYSVDIGNIVGRWVYPFHLYSWCERRDGNILAGSDGHVYTMNTGYSDDSEAILFQLVSPALWFGDSARYKRPIDFEALLIVENAVPDLSLQYGFGGVGLLSTSLRSQPIALESGAILYYWDVALWDESYWANVGGSYLYRTSDLIGRGRFMLAELSHSTPEARVTVAHAQIGHVLEGAN